MARQPRLLPEGYPAHIIQRGINRETCFLTDRDRAVYIRALSDFASTGAIGVHGWVLMSNHVHLLVTPNEVGAASLLMQTLGRRYVRYFNDTHERTGGLFEGRFRSSLIQEESYLMNCLVYIELNPVRAGIVQHPSQYHWSSYGAHALGMDVEMHTPHPVYRALGDTDDARQRAYIERIRRNLEPGIIERIRRSANRNQALGDQRMGSGSGVGVATLTPNPDPTLP